MPLSARCLATSIASIVLPDPAGPVTAARLRCSTYARIHACSFVSSTIFLSSSSNSSFSGVRTSTRYPSARASASIPSAPKARPGRFQKAMTSRTRSARRCMSPRSITISAGAPGCAGVSYVPSGNAMPWPNEGFQRS